MVNVNFVLALCLLMCVATSALFLNINEIFKNSGIGYIAQGGHKLGNRIEQIIRKPDFTRLADGCPVITTTLGDIAGVRINTVFGNGTFCSYRGIRFAKAPVGELRFKVC